MAQGQTFVIDAERFELTDQGWRMDCCGGGYWFADDGKWADQLSGDLCRVEGQRVGFAHMDVEKVTRYSDGAVLFKRNPWWFTLEAVLVGGIAIAGVLIAIADTLTSLQRASCLLIFVVFR